VSVAILHHVGDGNVPPVRVPSTVALAEAFPSALVLVAAESPEEDALRAALGDGRVVRCGMARDTLGEVLASRRMARLLEIGTVYISTEPGHLGRAMAIARIVYAGSGVQVCPWPSAPGTYRSPWYATARDAVRAIVSRLFR
jgi:uncharacterized SAM-binding protein YcdF (DUF218 family)